MRKILFIFALLAAFFTGCEDKEEPIILNLNSAIPDDVNISQSETNITIDESLPPEPVSEGVK